MLEGQEGASAPCPALAQDLLNPKIKLAAAAV